MAAISNSLISSSTIKVSNFSQSLHCSKAHWPITWQGFVQCWLELCASIMQSGSFNSHQSLPSCFPILSWMVLGNYPPIMLALSDSEAQVPVGRKDEKHYCQDQINNLLIPMRKKSLLTRSGAAVSSLHSSAGQKHTHPPQLRVEQEEETWPSEYCQHYGNNSRDWHHNENSSV